MILLNTAIENIVAEMPEGSRPVHFKTPPRVLIPRESVSPLRTGILNLVPRADPAIDIEFRVSVKFLRVDITAECNARYFPEQETPYDATWFGSIATLHQTLVIPLSYDHSRKPVAASYTTKEPHVVARTLVTLASTIAGPRRALTAEAWRAHLLGDVDDGKPLGRRHQVATSLGFLVAAAHLRARDAGRQACRPLDWWLSTDGRVVGGVGVTVAVMCSDLFFDDGLTRVFENGENIVGIGLGVYGAAFALRKVRGITPKPPTRPGANAGDGE